MKLKTGTRQISQVIILSFVVCAIFEALETMVGHHLDVEPASCEPVNDCSGERDLEQPPPLAATTHRNKAPLIINGGPNTTWPRDKGKREPPGGLSSSSSHHRRALIMVAQAIRIARLEAPARIQAGQPLKLRCLYETKGDKLQSLSWLKDGDEFYRYQPGDRRIQLFNKTGIQVDLTRSRNSTVFLSNTTSETSGRYKCQATSLPSFQEANMEIFVEVLNAANSVAGIVLDWRLMILVYICTKLI